MSLLHNFVFSSYWLAPVMIAPAWFLFVQLYILDPISFSIVTER